MATAAVTPAVKITTFAKIKAFFKKFFGDEPAWSKVALNTLTVVAPLVETVLALVQPEFVAPVTSVLNTVKTDLATAAALIDVGQANPTLTGILQSVQTNIASIESLAGIKDAATQQKFAAIVTTITDEVGAILQSIPATQG